LNALYIMPSIIFKTNRENLDIAAQGRVLPTIKEIFSILLTFTLTVIAWIFFRSENVGGAWDYILEIFSLSLFTFPILPNLGLIALLIFFIAVEWIGRQEKYALATYGLNWPKAIRIGFYYVLVLTVLFFAGSEQQFIYFQF